MAYTLQAFIGDLSDLEQNAPSGAMVVFLGQGKGMIPLTDIMRELHEIPFLPITDEGSEELPSPIQALAEEFREPLAYVEAEFFGGHGTQASAVWKGRNLVFRPLVNPKAINQALQILGVTKGSCIDEFDALGLGKKRDTNSWGDSSNGL